MRQADIRAKPANDITFIRERLVRGGLVVCCSAVGSSLEISTAR